MHLARLGESHLASCNGFDKLRSRVTHATHVFHTSAWVSVQWRTHWQRGKGQTQLSCDVTNTSSPNLSYVQRFCFILPPDMEGSRDPM